MKILVTVKRVVDYATHIRIKADQTGIETANVKMGMNPFDEIALEEALRLKEKAIASEVIVVSIGSTACQETVRVALAMGADRGILVQTETDIQPLAAAKIFQAIAIKEKPTLILLGKQAIDDDSNQTGQMLAGLLNWAQGTFVSKLEVMDQRAVVTREIDGGLETLSLKLPAVITADLRLNEPRYLSLPNIIQAKQKTMTVIPLDELNVDTRARLKIIKIQAPEKRHAGVMVETVAELIDQLKHDQVLS